MAGNGKDHWLWNTRADDTGSIVEGYSLVFSIGGSEAYLWPPARLLNFTIARASTYFSASRRYGVTITGLLVTVYPAGQIQTSGVQWRKRRVQDADTVS